MVWTLERPHADYHFAHHRMALGVHDTQLLAKRPEDADLSTVAPLLLVNNFIPLKHDSGTPENVSEFKSESLSDLERNACPK